MLNSRSISHGRYQPQASGKGGGGAGGGTGGNGAVESALRAVPALGTGVLGAAALVRQGSGAIVRGAGAVGRRASEASGLTQRRVARDDKSLQTGTRQAFCAHACRTVGRRGRDARDDS